MEIQIETTGAKDICVVYTKNLFSSAIKVVFTRHNLILLGMDWKLTYAA